MSPRNVRFVRFAILLGAVAPAPVAFAQQFTRNTTNVPANAGNYTENVDFADIDNDGDWDAVFANGGDQAQLQNAVWLNQGFLQAGTLGNFLDATAARAPAVLDQSRDIEFVDFDADGDVDIYVSNTAQIVNQGNRWWANMGGAQGGSAGFYQEQTSTRWVGLGAAGSSIAPSQLIAGSFIDFSCDCDFGDIDNDGDVDLVHSSYGFSLQGNIPTRLFLNDGSGHFAEFNPSGFQLAGRDIANGNPGIWCQGTQSANTTNTTGVNCDVAASPLDIDVGDIDGDLDLDILHGSRNELPRMYVNRLVENGGTPTFFRDVTGSAFPAGYSTGQGHYEQEMGDFDSDGDLDIYGLNWQVVGASFNDVSFRNNGSGVYAAAVGLSGSSSDDNEADFFDYDLDGDLDVFVANFNGQERIYTGNGAGGTLTLASGLLPADGTISLDADCCDVDSDGDYDVFVANDLTGAASNEHYLQNGTTNNDVAAPVLRRLEQAANRTAGAPPTVVRVQVYDNAPYYITWYNTTSLEVQVNGGPTTVYPMKPSMGQIFRGEIPGNLVGTISYRAVSTDKYGNTGTTAFLNFNATGPAVFASFCAGDGLLADHTTPCPCANNGAAGNGCANSVNANGANLVATGTPASDNVVLSGSGMPAVVSCIYLQGDALSDGVFGDGVRCAGGGLIRLRTKNNLGGASSFPDSTDTITLSARGGVTPGSGLRRYYQTYYRNSAGGFCPPETFNVTNGWQIDW
ncbi:MAG: VCBS repeat-containing protein [Planctomycetes bacterium]|nr:VCBS repeat-containing protein [Planctomycetota bacterium]